MGSNRTRRLVYLAFLVALAVVFTRVFSFRFAIGGVEGIRIGLGALPIILSGFLFGPLAGGLVGAVADVLGYFINPLGVYMPHFTLTSLLTGLIPALVLRYVFRGKRSFLTYLIAIGLGQLISSVWLVTYFLELVFSVPRTATLIPYILSQAINVPLYAYLNHLLINQLKKTNLFLVDNN